MRTQEDIKLFHGDYSVHLELIAKHRSLSGAEKSFEDLPGTKRVALTLSALLHVYVQYHAYDKAEALIAKMSEFSYLTSPLSYNHMISMFLGIGKLQKIPELIKELEESTKPDTVTRNLWLTMCQSQNDVEAAENVFLEMRKAKLEPDWMTYSILASLYTKMEMNDKAQCSLNEMEKRMSRKNRSAYASLIIQTLERK